MTEARDIRVTGPDPHHPWPQPDDWAQIKDQVLHYLTNATPVMAARSRGADLLDPEATFVVPLLWMTDGTYTWPGALAYYARRHDQAPEPQFLDHLRHNDFRPPTTPEGTATRALDVIVTIQQAHTERHEPVHSPSLDAPAGDV